MAGIALKRQLSRQHREHYHSHRPYVDPPVNLVVFVVDKALRGHISQTSDVQVLPTHCLHGPSYSEVYHLDMQGFSVDEQQVLQLQITMDESIGMTISHGLDDLFNKDPCHLLRESFEVLNELKEFSSFQVLHDDDYFHVLQGEAIFYFDNILVLERFQCLGFHENAIDIRRVSSFVGLYYFDCVFLASLPVNCQPDFPEAAFPKFFGHLKFAKAAGRIKILAIGRVQSSFTLDKLEIVLEILSALRVEKSEMLVLELFLDLPEAVPFAGNLDLDGLFIQGSIVIHVDKLVRVG